MPITYDNYYLFILMSVRWQVSLAVLSTHELKELANSFAHVKDILNILFM